MLYIGSSLANISLSTYTATVDKHNTHTSQCVISGFIPVLTWGTKEVTIISEKKQLEFSAMEV